MVIDLSQYPAIARRLLRYRAYTILLFSLFFNEIELPSRSEISLRYRVKYKTIANAVKFLSRNGIIEQVKIAGVPRIVLTEAGYKLAELMVEEVKRELMLKGAYNPKLPVSALKNKLAELGYSPDAFDRIVFVREEAVQEVSLKYPGVTTFLHYIVKTLPIVYGGRKIELYFTVIEKKGLVKREKT